MAPENVLPFCSRATRSAVDVLELKNFSHVAVIAATAPELLAELPLAAGAEAEADAGAEAEAEPDPELAADVLELLLQAATVTASARPSVRLSAGVIIRRARESDRMTRLLFSVRCIAQGGQFSRVLTCLLPESAPNVSRPADGSRPLADASVRVSGPPMATTPDSARSTSGNARRCGRSSSNPSRSGGISP